MKKELFSFCGFGKRSSKLEGAISPKQDFLYLSKFRDEYGVEENPEFTNIREYLFGGFDVDEENDIIIGDMGAVLDAYEITDEEQIEEILKEQRMKYGEYDLELIPGDFPIDAISGDGMLPDDIVFSTHVLYITNYKEFIKDNKVLTK